jgi:hypothetical protein
MSEQIKEEVARRAFAKVIDYCTGKDAPEGMIEAAAIVTHTWASERSRARADVAELEADITQSLKAGLSWMEKAKAVEQDVAELLAAARMLRDRLRRYEPDEVDAFRCHVNFAIEQAEAFAKHSEAEKTS